MAVTTAVKVFDIVTQLLSLGSSKVRVTLSNDYFSISSRETRLHIVTSRSFSGATRHCHTWDNYLVLHSGNSRRMTMCSVVSRAKPVQRALALTLLRANTEGSSYALAESRRFCPGVSTSIYPLRATSRSYCSRMALTEGLLFRQVGSY